MNLKNQKRIAAQLLKVGEHKVKFDIENLSDIKEAITKHDIRGLINSGIISTITSKGQSRARIRKSKAQKRKGKRAGEGSRKGCRGARITRKQEWMKAIRTQRRFIFALRANSKVSPETFKSLYKMTKSGLFRSRRHIKLYLTENNLFIRGAKDAVKEKTTG